MPSIIPLIAIDLDKPRHLLLDHKAVRLCELEMTRFWGRETTFYSAMQGLLTVVSEGDMARLSFNNLSILLWQALVHEDPLLTLDAVQAALPYTDPSGLVPYIGKLLEAWTAQTPSFNATAQAEADAKDPLDGSTGVSAGHSPALASA